MINCGKMEERSHAYPSNEDCVKKLDKSLNFSSRTLMLITIQHQVRGKHFLFVLQSVSSSLLVVTELSVTLT